ncbi:MAG: RES family NAD+ phosphorylase [Nitrospiraceae bacterium]|nr:MAG: RES family NAD+ phosphorylase [Nitrospiraceae bacterium]
MKRAWRIVRKKRLADAFTGEGARLGGGRWNKAGIPAVYISETLSLAAIELFVHFTRKDLKLGRSLLAIPVEIPATLRQDELSMKELPPDWRTSPPPNSTKALGSAWAAKGNSAVLRVPSAIIPEEYNLVLNPRHPDFRKIKIGRPRSFSLDERMWK